MCFLYGVRNGFGTNQIRSDFHNSGIRPVDRRFDFVILGPAIDPVTGLKQPTSGDSAVRFGRCSSAEARLRPAGGTSPWQPSFGRAGPNEDWSITESNR